MTDKKTEALKLALKRAFNLGQTYWQQADSEYTSQWKKADVTLASFNQLVEDTIREALAESRSDEEQPAPGSHLTDEQKAANGLAWLARLEALREEFAGLAERVEPAFWTRKQWGMYREFCEKPFTTDWEPLYTSPPAQQQEPVAEVRCDDGGNLTAHFYVRDLPLLSKLYTSTQPSKPWVGLTKEEILEINDTVREQQGWLAFARAIETKLKAKNSL